MDENFILLTYTPVCYYLSNTFKPVSEAKFLWVTFSSYSKYLTPDVEDPHQGSCPLPRFTQNRGAWRN